jgi:hypothetical protein
MEGVVIAADDSTRMQALSEIATQHAATGDALAELRTLIRMLGAEPTHAPTLERLEEVFTQGGDVERLLIVLNVALQSSDDVGHRRALWLKMASLSEQVANDSARGANPSGWLPLADGQLVVRLRAPANGVLEAAGQGCRVEAPGNHRARW